MRRALRFASVILSAALCACANGGTQAGATTAHPPPSPAVKPPAQAVSQRPAPAQLGTAAASAQPAPARRPPDYEQADLDPTNDLVVAPPASLPGCEDKLTAAGVEFRPASFPLKQRRGDIYTCGAEQVVTFLKGAEGFKYNARPTFTCRMALALSRFEQVAEEQAKRHLGQGIKKVTQIGTYSCRKMARFNLVSEHSYANAIDVKGFTLESGAYLTVKTHFGRLDRPPQTREAKFLRTLAQRLYDENVFSVVLTPHWDQLHHDHFHFDLAKYRADGTR